MIRRPPTSPLFPSTTLFRSLVALRQPRRRGAAVARGQNHNFRWRPARTVHHAMARENSRRNGLPRAGGDDGFAADTGEAGRRPSSWRPHYRWKGHLALDVRPTRRQDAARRLFLLLGQTSAGRAERQMEIASAARI